MNFFVGLWPIVWHYTLGLGFIGICIAVFIFSSALVAEVPLLAPFLKQIREYALIAAAVAAFVVIAYSAGVRDRDRECKAQFAAAQQASIKHSTVVHSRASSDVSRGVRDPRDTDSK